MEKMKKYQDSIQLVLHPPSIKTKSNVSRETDLKIQDWQNNQGENLLGQMGNNLHPCKGFNNKFQRKSTRMKSLIKIYQVRLKNLIRLWTQPVTIKSKIKQKNFKGK
jgi:hypothetical protein